MSAPTAADGGDGASATVSFTAISGISSYTAISTPGSFTGTGAASPITVSGLTAGTAYTFQVRAENTLGNGAYSAASNSVTPVVPAAFESIASATGTGSSGTITFSSIPSTYKSLQIRCNFIPSVAGTIMQLRVNGDTGLNYSRHFIATQGANGLITAQTSQGGFNIGPTNGTDTTQPNLAIIDIHNYQAVGPSKTIRFLSGVARAQASNSITIGGGMWNSSAAITSVTLVLSSGNFSTNSTMSLYGIKG
jgi:hypothetical protein